MYVFMYKFHNKLLPESLLKTFVCNIESHNYETRNVLNARITSHTKVCITSHLRKCPSLWLLLNNDTKSCKTLNNLSCQFSMYFAICSCFSPNFRTSPPTITTLYPPTTTTLPTHPPPQLKYHRIPTTCYFIIQGGTPTWHFIMALGINLQSLICISLRCNLLSLK